MPSFVTGIKNLFMVEKGMYNSKPWIYIFYRTFATMFNMGYTLLFRRKPVIMNGRLVVTYSLDDQKYTVLPKIGRGAQPTIHVSCGEGLNVTKVILEYMGPNLDFHEQKLTPSTLGYDFLDFEIMDTHGDISHHHFSSEDILKIN